MPPDWSKYWRGAAQDVNERGKFTPAVIAGAILLPFGLTFMALGLGYSLLSIFTRTFTQLLPGLLVLLMGLLMIYGRFRLASAPDPALVKQKINASAFRVRIRIFHCCRVIGTTACTNASYSRSGSKLQPCGWQRLQSD